MPKVVHLIPFHDIGGVEVAANSMREADCSPIRFEVMSIFPETRGRLTVFNPWHFLRAARRLAMDSPDVLILSLWRSALTGLLVRLLNRRVRIVLFLHNSRDAHVLDRWVTGWAARRCEEIWADSRATATLRLPSPPQKPIRVISFLVARVAPATTAEPRPVFAFWGRLSPQKDVASALRIFARILAARPDARFLIIGPDGGELGRLRDLAKRLEITSAVTFTGPMTREQIFATAAQASFYLGTSRYEGMAISVVEAMQLGLVPLVRAVGEIARYCVADENALLIDSEKQAARDVLTLVEDESRYGELRQGAITAWLKRPLYSESVAGELARLLRGSPETGTREVN